jgi:hypothetical protein
VDGRNSISWNPVGGAARYAVYREDAGPGGAWGDEVLVAVVESAAFDDPSAKSSVSRYRVSVIDEIGCEGQVSCPVEVSSAMGSDLSLALAVVGGPDGTLALTWDNEGLESDLLVDFARTDRGGERVFVTVEPVDAWLTDRWVDESVEPGETYLYEAVLHGDGTIVGSAEGVSEAERPSETRLLGCFPHPMVNATTFAFDVGGERSTAVETTLTIYDPAGRLVRRLVDEPVTPGSHTVDWDGTTDSGARVASGCYFFSLTTGDEVRSGKLLVVR